MNSATQQNLEVRNLYAKIEKVGEGTYASVFLAKNVKTGRKVAIKKIKIVSNANGMDVTAIREVKFLRELRHPNVIQVGGRHPKHQAVDVLISNTLGSFR